MADRSCQLGNGPVGAHGVVGRQLVRQVGNNRHRMATRWLARWAQQIVAAYDNYNYDMTTNGEQWVLERIGLAGLHCIFDVGANTGEWARMANRLHPAASIHCFEVIDDTFARLLESVGHLSNVYPVNIGLSDGSGTRQFKVYDDDSTKASMCDYPHPGLRYHWMKRPVTTGDSYLRCHSIRHIDFLKLDVEGGEQAALQGFSQALEFRCIDAVQFEYGRVNVLNGIWLRDLWALFEERGYMVGRIYPRGVDWSGYDFARDEDFRGANFLALRQELVDLAVHLEGHRARSCADTVSTA
jgi:FkbM family methyltransferase